MRLGSRCGSGFSRLGRTFLVFFVVVATPAAWALQGSGDESGICQAASRYAAAKTGVPLDVLRAISLSETGRRSRGRLQPWPWTVNMQGVGKWFDTRSEALAFTERNFTRGARSFDVGCFQINFRWHGAAFPSIDAMFDPRENAVYAARFLRSLYEETGSWARAAGAYHSRTPELARGYQQRFERILARLGPADAPALTDLAETREPDVSPSRPPRSIVAGALLASQSAGDNGTTAPGSLVTLAVRANGWSILTPARGALY